MALLTHEKIHEAIGVEGLEIIKITDTFIYARHETEVTIDGHRYVHRNEHFLHLLPEGAGREE